MYETEILDLETAEGILLACDCPATAGNLRKVIEKLKALARDHGALSYHWKPEPEVIDIFDYQFPEGLRLKDWGEGVLLEPIYKDQSTYLKRMRGGITDGVYEHIFEYSYLGEHCLPCKLLKSDMDKQVVHFLKGREALLPTPDNG